MAIGIRLKKVCSEHDLSISKFFGIPTLPKGVAETLSPDAVFIAQINLKDIIPFDKDNKLPHEGYLYFFMETEDETPYSHKEAVVIYSNQEVEIAIDDFNAESPISEGLNDDYAIEFFEIDDSYTGIKLLGVPSDWNYQDEPKELLLQYDPLDTDDLDFFSYMDGYIYFFYKNENKNFNEVVIHLEYS